MLCSVCKKDFPDEVMEARWDILGVLTCRACTPQQPDPIGEFDYPDQFHERNEGVGGLIVIQGKPGKRR